MIALISVPSIMARKYASVMLNRIPQCSQLLGCRVAERGRRVTEQVDHAEHDAAGLVRSICDDPAAFGVAPRAEQCPLLRAL